MITRRSLLALPLLAGCARLPGAASSELGVAGDGAGSATADPQRVFNIVCLGDSITQASHDESARGGYVGRLVEHCDAAHPGRFKFLGTSYVKGHVYTAYCEGHGGLDAQGLLAALDDKPVAKVPSGKPMFGPDGWWPDVDLVVYAGGANNCNNATETTEQTDAAQRAFFRRLFEQLDSSPGSANALVATMGGYLSIGGIWQYQAKADLCNAIWDPMIADLEAAHPGRMVKGGYRWQNAVGPRNDTTYADEIHPNGTGYDDMCTTPLAGPGLIEWLAPTLAAMVGV